MSKKMSILTKQVDELTADDFRSAPVWEYVNNDEAGECTVRPVRKLPVKDLNNRLVGVEIKLNCGNTFYGMLGNIDAQNPKNNEHFLTISIERKGKWFHLARYHDWDHSKKGPIALAKFLKLDVDDVFPIRYDIRPVVEGNPKSLADKIEIEPRKKLSRSEIIALAVKG